MCSINVNQAAKAMLLLLLLLLPARSGKRFQHHDKGETLHTRYHCAQR